MHTRRSFHPLLAAVFLTLGLLACNLPTTPETPSPTPPATATPESPPSPSPTPPDAATPTDPPPTATAESSWLPAGTYALYAMGPWQDLWLQALSTNGTSTELDEHVALPAAVSRTGLWIAFPGGPQAPDSILIRSLENDTSFAIQLTEDFDVYGAAFDLAETRLAFLEAGGPTGPGPGTPWVIVVVSLAGGSTTRFDRSSLAPVG